MLLINKHRIENLNNSPKRPIKIILKYLILIQRKHLNYNDKKEDNDEQIDIVSLIGGFQIYLFSVIATF